MPTPTQYYGWQKPDIGASTDAWGGLLNTDLDQIDAQVHTNQTAASTTYVAKAGDTMTGNLTIAPASTGSNITISKSASGQQNTVIAQTAGSNRWGLFLGNTTAEGAGNAGSDFAINSYDNTGASIGTPLAITRANGNATFSTNFGVNVNKTASGQNAYFGGMTNGSQRWAMMLGNSNPESGSNNGSDFVLNAYTDGNAYLSAPLTITRATGNATFSTNAGVSINAPSNNCQLVLNKAAGAFGNMIIGQRAGSTRWIVQLGDNGAETGSPSGTGSSLSIIGYKDDGTTGAILCAATRSNNVMSFTNAIVNGSDARLKENIKPIENALETVKQLRGVSFNRIGQERRDIGFIAQEVAPLSPESVQASASITIGDATGQKAAEDADSPMLALDYGGMVALMAEAIKTLSARVEALEAARG